MCGNSIFGNISDKAFRFGKDLFWGYSEALQVIDKITIMNCAIVGVELFERVGESPKWIATSNYHHDNSIPWSKYVQLCNNSAKEFVEANKVHKGGLFNFGYIQESEKNEWPYKPQKT